jgi:hypothetical protein
MTGVGYLVGAGIGLLQDRRGDRDLVPLLVATLAIYFAYRPFVLWRTSKGLLGSEVSR